MKKLTISVDDEIYQGLHNIVGRGKISKFIEDKVRPYVIKSPLEAGYRDMAADREREQEAHAWLEGLVEHHS